MPNKQAFILNIYRFFMADLSIEYKHVDDLIPYINNSRTHSDEQVTQVAASIKEFGFTNPILVDENNGIIAGHGRLMAAKKLKLEQVPTITLAGLSDAQRKAYVIADNKLALNAGWDLELLKVEIDELKDLDFDIDLLGFNADELADLIPEIETLADGKEDEVPEPPVDPVTKRGDIWLLGNHRLMCGDSTMIDDVEKLMNGNKADILFTSPPYNVGKTPNGNDNKYREYKDNQIEQEYLSLLIDFTNNGLLFSDYVFCNVQSVAGNKTILIDYLYQLKEKFADTIIWDKETAEPAMARRVLNSRFEYIHIFSNDATRAVGKKDFRGDVPNVFKLNSRAGKEFAKIHKATFRVELPEYFIDKFVETSVMDLFGGTGTTMIAAEKKKVKSFLMELDNVYCDVIIKRWQDYAGKEATLESTGETYNSMVKDNG